MRIVAALGGNALLERGERPDSGIQEAHVDGAARPAADPGPLDHGIIPVCSGGGGIPVVRDPSGDLRGVEAVVDAARGRARRA
jgi:carbamate kinase